MSWGSGSRLRAALAVCAVLLYPTKRALGAVVIRQIIEGSSFNKAVEVVNHGGAQGIGGWSLEEYVNSVGSGRVRFTFPDGFQLQSGETHMVCHPRADEGLNAYCSDVASWGLNGNDAVVLLDSSGAVQDQFGDSQGQTLTGTTWSIACVSGASADHTLLRADAIQTGTKTDAAWKQALSTDWQVFSQDVVFDQQGLAADISTGGQVEAIPLNSCGGGTGSPPQGPATGEAPFIGQTGDFGDCSQPPAGAPDGRLQQDRWRVLAYNAEWLFDGVQDPAASNYAQGMTAAADTHLARVAAYLAGFGADTLLLSEVEDCNMLERLARRMRANATADTEPADTAGLVGLLAQGTDAGTRQDVAMLTRVLPSEVVARINTRVDTPLPESTCGSDGKPGNTGVSKNLVAKFESLQLGGEQLKVAIVAAHLRAFPTNKAACVQREGQARLLRSHVESLHSEGYEIIIAGDLNDFSEETPDAANSEPISQVLNILAAPNAGQNSAQLPPRLYNVMAELPPSDRFTAWYDKDRDGNDDGAAKGENTAIDHVLVTKGLRDRIAEVVIDHSDASPSDHWPIIVTFASSEGASTGTTPSIAVPSCLCRWLLWAALWAAVLI